MGILHTLFGISLLQHVLALAADLLVGPSIVKIPQSWNDVFPASNFNRNVSVPLWQMTLISGARSATPEDLQDIANASFVVLHGTADIFPAVYGAQIDGITAS